MSTHDPRLDATRATPETAEPVVVAKADDREDKTAAALIAGGLAVIALWAGAVAAFGWLGLLLPALAAVPVLFLLLVLITRG